MTRLRIAALLLALLWPLGLCRQTARADPGLGGPVTVRLTHYDYPGVMADGNETYLGAASCGYAWPMGTQLELPDGWVVTCEDRGAIEPDGVDLWAPSAAWGWMHVTGRYGDWVTVVPVRWGWDDQAGED